MEQMAWNEKYFYGEKYYGFKSFILLDEFHFSWATKPCLDCSQFQVHPYFGKL